MDKGLLFDIGANRGDATYAGLALEFEKIIALEPAPKMFALLSENFMGNDKVIPLKFAVSDSLFEEIEFYECPEDGLSSTSLDWFTAKKSPYMGKFYKTIKATTCTLDYLCETYGNPDLVKIDVEGAESSVFRGLVDYKPKQLCFEWTDSYLADHLDDLERLRDVNGYTEFALQYITHHLDEPQEYRSLKNVRQELPRWLRDSKGWWESEGWIEQGALRPTADVGMIWVKQHFQP